MFINNTNFKDVNEEDFKTWKKKFKDYLIVTLEPILDNSPSFADTFPVYFNIEKKSLDIEISNETPKEIYGTGSVKELKEELKHKCKDILGNDAKRIIEEIDKIKEFNQDEIYNISEQLSIIFKKQSESIALDIKKKKNRFRFENIILGKYTYNSYWDFDKPMYDNCKITLYINNIKKCKGNLMENIEQTFIHELFHYFHNRCGVNAPFYEEFFMRYDYQSTVIKEAFARYFELNYMKDKYPAFDYNKSLYDLRNHSVSVYPYSGALYINSMEHLFKLMGKNMNEAIIELLYKADIIEYYDVLNHDYDEAKLAKAKLNKPVTGVTKKPKNQKNYDKFEFNGNIYPKGRLVLAIVKDYCDKNPGITFDELEAIFPPKLAKNGKGVIKKLSDVSDNDMGKNGKQKKYFLNDDDVLNLDTDVVVSNQFKQENVYNVIEVARKLGMSIDVIPTDKFINELYDFINSTSPLELPRKKDNRVNVSPVDLSGPTIYSFIKVNVSDDEILSEMLKRLMDERGLTQTALCKRCFIDKKQAKGILNRTTLRPEKETIYKICIGMELDFNTGMDFIGKAGVKIRDTDLMDRLVYDCLKKGYFNKSEIDSTLVHFGYSTFFDTTEFNDEEIDIEE